jgi:hypothetical protein
MKINIDLKNKQKHYEGFVIKNISSTDEQEEAIFEFIILLRKSPILLWITPNNLKSKKEIEESILTHFSSIINKNYLFNLEEHNLNDKVSFYSNENVIPPKIL